MRLDKSRIYFQWKEKDIAARFRTGVSLHGHTLHSRESLDFIERATARTPWLSGAIRKQMRRYREKTGRDLDLSRAWWTPPLSALQAWKVEKAQIEELGLSAEVSLSDHDNADAGIHLSVLEETRHSPVSVEWTVPWRETFFHVGLHNLPVDQVSRIMPELAALTARPVEDGVTGMLAALNADPAVLIIWNHPLWDEGQIGAELHRQCAESFLARMGSFLHAFELNGLRPWKENRDVIAFAEAVSFPVISGGDRHGREPNACLNLSKAASFTEFVEEVRRDGWSNVLFMPQYRDAFQLRIVQNLCDILEDDPAHSLGWTSWCDRAFYRGDDGAEKSLRELWGRNSPAVVSQFVGLMSLVRHSNIRKALRLAFARMQEVGGD